MIAPPGQKEAPEVLAGTRGAETNGIAAQRRTNGGDYVNFPALVREQRSDVAQDAGEGSGQAAEGGRPAPLGLPCLNSNNCPKSGAPKGYQTRKTVTTIEGPVGFAQAVTRRVVEEPGVRSGLDSSGRHWSMCESGIWERLGSEMTGAERKRAFSLRSNADAFFGYYGRDRTGMFTLSPPAGTTPKELAGRFADARKHNFQWLISYFRVLEPRSDGTAHHHYGAAVDFEMKPDAFPWDAFKAAQEQAPRRGRPAGPDFHRLKAVYVAAVHTKLREIWSENRRVCEQYGLGRAELLPIRTNAQAMAHYVGAYLEGGMVYRCDGWKGSRRIEFDRKQCAAWRRCGSAFGWMSGGAREWRRRVGELACAAAIPFDDLKALALRFGRRWAHDWRKAILMTPSTEWRQALHVLADLYGGDVVEKPLVTDSGKVVGCWTSHKDFESSGLCVGTASMPTPDIACVTGIVRTIYIMLSNASAYGMLTYVVVVG